MRYNPAFAFRSFGPVVRPVAGGGGEPPPSGKDISAPALTNKGLVFTGITDSCGTQYETGDWRDLFAPYKGGRIRQDPTQPGGTAQGDRHSIVTAQGRRCLRVLFRANNHGLLVYNTMWLGNVFPDGLDEMGFRASIYVPSDFVLRSITDRDIDGKSTFGIIVGQKSGYDPSKSWPVSDGNYDQVSVPSWQGGNAVGVNTMGRKNGRFELTTYAHIPGGRGTGGVWRHRAHRWSIAEAISGYATPERFLNGKQYAMPKGQWVTVEVYVKMDTSLTPPNGIFEIWVTPQGGAPELIGHMYEADLGGTVADREALGMPLYNKDSTATPPATTTNQSHRGPLMGVAVPSGGPVNGGWKIFGLLCREMLGGAYDDHHKPDSQQEYFVADWAVYKRP